MFGHIFIYVWKLPGQWSNPRRSCNPHHGRSNARFLTPALGEGSNPHHHRDTARWKRTWGLRAFLLAAQRKKQRLFDNQVVNIQDGIIFASSGNWRQARLNVLCWCDCDEDWFGHGYIPGGMILCLARFLKALPASQPAARAPCPGVTLLHPGSAP